MKTTRKPAPREIGTAELKQAGGGAILICIEHKGHTVCTLQ